MAFSAQTIRSFLPSCSQRLCTFRSATSFAWNGARQFRLGSSPTMFRQVSATRHGALFVIGSLRAQQPRARGSACRPFSTSVPTLESIDSLIEDGKHKEAMLEAWTLSHKLWSEGVVDECFPLAERVLTCSKALHNEKDHIDIAEALNNKGVVLARMSRFDEAIETLEEALKMKTSLVGPQDTAVAETLRNLGNINAQTGKFDAAEEKYEECIAILTKQNEKNLLKHSLQMIAWGFGQQQQPERAAKYAQKLADLKPVGADGGTIDDFWRVFDEGCKHVEQGNFQGGVNSFEDALHVLNDLQQKPENEMQLIAKCLINTASALFNMGELDGAELFVQEGMKRQDEAGTADPQDRIVALNSLGNIRRERGDLDEALRVFEEILPLHTELMGPDHPDRSVYLTNIALVYSKRGELDQATSHLQEALAIHKRHGVEDLLTARIYSSLGSALFGAAKYEEAAPMKAEAVRAFKAVVGGEHQEVAHELSALGHIQLMLNQHASAVDTIQESLDVARKLFGDEHGHVVWALHKIGEALLAQGQAEEALGKYGEALELQRRLGPQDAMMASLCRNVAALLWGQERWQESMERFEEEHAVLLNMKDQPRERVEDAKHWADLARERVKAARGA